MTVARPRTPSRNRILLGPVRGAFFGADSLIGSEETGIATGVAACVDVNAVLQTVFRLRGLPSSSTITVRLSVLLLPRGSCTLLERGCKGDAVRSSCAGIIAIAATSRNGQVTELEPSVSVALFSVRNTDILHLLGGASTPKAIATTCDPQRCAFVLGFVWAKEGRVDPPISRQESEFRANRLCFSWQLSATQSSARVVVHKNYAINTELPP